jgi:Tol biopolymer transport system component
LIALAIQSSDQSGEHVQVCALAVGSGKVQPLAGPRLLWVEHLAWVNGTSGLAIVGRQHASAFRQLWYVAYPSGPFRRLGSDIDSYVGASATDSGLSIVSVQLQTLANIYIAGGRDLSHPTQVTPGTGRYFDLSWTPDGRILYASDSTGEADIWSINADGSDQKQLTGGTGLNWAPVASPDGRHIAFHSNRSGSWHIWRMNADASQPVQLTNGRMESRWPHYIPDGSQLLFHQTGSDGMWNIWSIASDGGTARRLTAFMTTHPAVSRKDGKIAAWYSESIERPNWKLAVFGPEGGTPLQLFTPEVAITPDSQLAWNPAGDAITCLGQQDGAWNLWMQPIDGHKPWRLTSFKSGQIYSFDWSKDSKLVYSQGMTTSDVVMLHDRRRGSAGD